MIDSIDALPRRLADKLMPEPNTGCWLWIGATSRGWDRGKVRQAHRVVYEAASGKRLRRSTTLDHVKARGCSTIVCCNPAHLEPVSRSTNNRRSSCHHRRGPGGRFV